ncbi:MAG: MBL fold metallo-hydrolase [Verrucomicrobia bacterium]|jgi:phosphoribosyl 1,2-cyclic phosphodiesterase|nr:MBL fold metallo-hydrolase [Verrucomicrobiota bacterium]
MSAASPSKFLATFWGTRGSISTPGSSTEKYGGNTPCVSVQHRDSRIILDAGTGIRPLGLEVGPELRAKAPSPQHILLSHTHWDHIQGLPFFEPAYIPGAELIIYGSPQKESFLEAILRGQMDINYFPVEMKELAASVTIREVGDQVISIGDVQIEIQEQVCHPGGSVRFRLEAEGKRIVYATDVELNAIFEPPEPSASMDRLATEYREFISGVDLLIADGQFTTEEYETRKGWGHTSIPLLLRVASEQGVKQLAVFHHDPERSDMLIDALWHEHAPEYRRGPSPMNVFWAREGMTVEI